MACHIHNHRNMRQLKSSVSHGKYMIHRSTESLIYVGSNISMTIRGRLKWIKEHSKWVDESLP